MFSRRTFVKCVAGSSFGSVLPPGWTTRQSARSEHYATGATAGVTSTSIQATDAALWALDQGGNAADAYITAAITQTVCEPGLTSLGGAFGMHYFDAASRDTTNTVGLLGPAAAEPYDYERDSPVTQTGRAMPVPGFLAGVFVTHRRHGRLDWAKLFQPAIGHANNGFLVGPEILAVAKRKVLKEPQSRMLWTRDGQYLQSDQPLVQSALGKLLAAVANDGPLAFYKGDFAKHYVQRAQVDGGRITLDDFGSWESRVRQPALEQRGNYRGYQMAAAPLLIYGMHLNEALDLRSSKCAASSPESVYKQLRIMEEVFLSAKELTRENEAAFVDPQFAQKRSDFVLNSARRKFTLDAIFNTCFLVIRDREGNCAWGTHSINAPTAFGAGIMVDGVYASYAINRGHVHGDGATAPGISTSYAIFKDGLPELVVGSPGYGFVHGPYQYGTGIIEWNLSPTEAMNLPRFSLPNDKGEMVFERHYDPAVVEMLENRQIAHQLVRPSSSTGLVGAFFSDPQRRLHFAQDGRRSGFAKAR